MKGGPKSSLRPFLHRALHLLLTLVFNTFCRKPDVSIVLVTIFSRMT